MKVLAFKYHSFEVKGLDCLIGSHATRIYASKTAKLKCLFYIFQRCFLCSTETVIFNESRAALQDSVSDYKKALRRRLSAGAPGETGETHTPQLIIRLC